MRSFITQTPGLVVLVTRGHTASQTPVTIFNLCTSFLGLPAGVLRSELIWGKTNKNSEVLVKSDEKLAVWYCNLSCQSPQSHRGNLLYRLDFPYEGWLTWSQVRAVSPTRCAPDQTFPSSVSGVKAQPDLILKNGMVGIIFAMIFFLSRSYIIGLCLKICIITSSIQLLNIIELNSRKI